MDKEKGSGGGSGSGIPASKAYSSHLAVQTDAAKYRGKYKELKLKVWQIEKENDKLHFKTLRIKRNIQRMRLERAILYERLEAEIGANQSMTEPGLTSRRASMRASNDRQVDEALLQPSNSTPAGRRVIDYSPSPEDSKTPNSTNTPLPAIAPASNGELRSAMKVTLKRNSHANGKEPSW